MKIAGSSIATQSVLDFVAKVAPTELSVLISGETGTGKSLVASAIHGESPRQNGPFVEVNCGAIPPSLLEDALFGAPPGTTERAQPGAFERAQGGTLCLEELGVLPDELQQKLLSAIDRGESPREGEAPSKFDVRVIAASSGDLERMMAKEKFRSDLYYRLGAVRITLAPLRDRLDDLPQLIEHFFEDSREELDRYGARARRVGPLAFRELRAHQYPGNVRELWNVLHRAALFAQGEEILPDDLPSEVRTAEPQTDAETTTTDPDGDAATGLRAAKTKMLDIFERKYLELLLERHRRRISSAAREAGIGQRHLRRLLHKHALKHSDPSRFGAA